MLQELLFILGPPLIVFFGAMLKHYGDKKKKGLEVEKLQSEIENLRAQTDSLKSENKDYEVKLKLFDNVMDLPFFNELTHAVESIFDNTKADRFLVLVARNGKTDFNVVSVVIEQHKTKEYRINAIARYRNIEIDDVYRKMLKQTEHTGIVEFETKTMPQGLLKDFYEIEGVKYSKVRFLARKPIDEDNDFLLYSSISTHENEPFTRGEMAYIKAKYESTIIPSLNKVID